MKTYPPVFRAGSNGQQFRVLVEEVCENACGTVVPYGFVPESGCPIHDV